MKNTLTKTQKWVLALALVPMIVVGVAGGYGTFHNISGAYGSGTAVGALAAGEGATAVLAFLLLGLTLLGQSSPLVIRIGLWTLPAAAAVMGSTAATEGTGQTVVYAVTPMAITASAEGLAFLVRRIVVHIEGRDVEAEARAAAVIRDLAYHQARAASHPSEGAKKRSVRKSWRLARKVGTGDVALGTQLLDVQRARLVAGADTALERLFLPATSTPVPGLPALPAASADVLPELPAASAGELVTSQAHESTIQADTNGRPTDTPSDQGEEAENVHADAQSVQPETEKKPSIAADVRQMVADGVKDVRHIVDAIATRHDRKADDPRLKSTVGKYVRAAQAAADADAKDDVPVGQYL